MEVRVPVDVDFRGRAVRSHAGRASVVNCVLRYCNRMHLCADKPGRQKTVLENVENTKQR